MNEAWNLAHLVNTTSWFQIYRNAAIYKALLFLKLCFCCVRWVQRTHQKTKVLARQTVTGQHNLADMLTAINRVLNLSSDLHTWCNYLWNWGKILNFKSYTKCSLLHFYNGCPQSLAQWHRIFRNLPRYRILKLQFKTFGRYGNQSDAFSLLWGSCYGWTLEKSWLQQPEIHRLCLVSK